jgi:hypothetical protein
VSIICKRKREVKRLRKVGKRGKGEGEELAVAGDDHSICKSGSGRIFGEGWSEGRKQIKNQRKTIYSFHATKLLTIVIFLR